MQEAPRQEEAGAQRDRSPEEREDEGPAGRHHDEPHPCRHLVELAHTSSRTRMPCKRNAQPARVLGVVADCGEDSAVVEVLVLQEYCRGPLCFEPIDSLSPALLPPTLAGLCASGAASGICRPVVDLQMR